MASRSKPPDVPVSLPPHLSSESLLEIRLLTAEAERGERSDGPSAPGLTVLVAGGDVELRAYLRRCLFHASDRRVCRVLEAADADAALKLLRGDLIDCLIADDRLPPDGGHALCQALHADHARPAMPMLLLCNQPGPRPRSAAPIHVLQAPFNARKLWHWLTHLLPPAS